MKEYIQKFAFHALDLADRTLERARRADELEAENTRLRAYSEDAQLSIKSLDEENTRLRAEIEGLLKEARESPESESEPELLSAFRESLGKSGRTIFLRNTFSKLAPDWKKEFILGLIRECPGIFVDDEVIESLRINCAYRFAIHQYKQGEPTFTLRGQDVLAPEIVREWAFRAKRLGTPAAKTEDARRIATEMEDWQLANTRHVPD